MSRIIWNIKPQTQRTYDLQLLLIHEVKIGSKLLTFRFVLFVIYDKYYLTIMTIINSQKKLSNLSFKKLLFESNNKQTWSRV